MRTTDFKKLINLIGCDRIIVMYMKCDIYLTDRQLEIVCKDSSHHNGCAFKYWK